MSAAEIYISVTLLLVALSMLGQDVVLQKVCWLLFANVVVSNVINELGMDPPQLQAFNAAFDLCFLWLIALVGYPTKHKLTVAISGLYLAMLAMHAYTIAENPANTVLYKQTLNVLFIGQLLVTGAWIVGELVGCYLRNRHSRLSEPRPVHIRGGH